MGEHTISRYSSFLSSPTTFVLIRALVSSGILRSSATYLDRLSTPFPHCNTGLFTSIPFYASPQAKFDTNKCHSMKTSGEREETNKNTQQERQCKINDEQKSRVQRGSRRKDICPQIHWLCSSVRHWRPLQSRGVKIRCSDSVNRKRTNFETPQELSSPCKRDLLQLGWIVRSHGDTSRTMRNARHVRKERLVRSGSPMPVRWSPITGKCANLSMCTPIILTRQLAPKREDAQSPHLCLR
jgi:hypothetical protein